MRLLVTGASGFIAQSFIKYSLKKNIQIIAISKKKKIYSHKKLKWIKGQFSKSNLKNIGKFDFHSCICMRSCSALVAYFSGFKLSHLDTI